MTTVEFACHNTLIQKQVDETNTGDDHVIQHFSYHWTSLGRTEQEVYDGCVLRKQAIRSYLRLMHELAIRVELIAYACDGKLNLTPPYAREYSYLQFRRICELTALGCLQLHGDLPVARTKTATKEWNADRIMRLLHRNHPHAFPQSVTTTNENGVWRYVANSKPNALTLTGFKTLYGECGDLLHRGIIRSIESENGLPACSVFSDFVGGNVKVATYNFAFSPSKEAEGGSAAQPRAEDGLRKRRSPLASTA